MVSQSSRNPGHILVVDDEQADRDLVVEVLEDHDYRVTSAGDGIEALTMVKVELPDVVLLDVTMPKLNGFETCRRLRAEPTTSHLPIILVTALKARETRLQGIEAGANDFLTKPLDLQDVLLRVRNALHLTRLHDELQAHCEELERLEDLRQDLTDMIIHDMRTPLGVVSGALQMMEMTGETSELVDMAREATANVIDMISDLLEITRMEDQALKLELQRLFLPGLVQDTVKRLKPFLQQYGVSCNVQVVDTGLEVFCDKSLINRVCENLVSNAVKHAPDQTSIDIQVAKHGDSVRTVVKDHGPGIPAEYRDRIFNKFVQVEDRQANQVRRSTGLGLTYCQLAVQAHNGKIGVECPNDGGSDFWFTLPLASEFTER